MITCPFNIYNRGLTTPSHDKKEVFSPYGWLCDFRHHGHTIEEVIYSNLQHLGKIDV